jgi:2'-5' RNA ligase
VTTPQRPGHSALVVPVPAFEQLVRSRHEHYDRDYLSTDPTFAHAHITLLAPFVAVADLTAEVVRGVGEILCRTTPFDLSLERVATFPNGIIHLVPEPDRPLRDLTAALWRAFPAYPPYAGAYGDVRPHLTVDARGPGVDENVVRAWVGPLVPARASVQEVRLSWYEPGACRTLTTWPLEGPALSRG